MEVARKTPNNYTMPKTNITGIRIDNIDNREPRILVLKIKGNKKIPVYMLDGSDDFKFPPLADFQTAFTYLSNATKGNNYVFFQKLCHLLSGDAYERSLWRDFFHLLPSIMIREWKKNESSLEAQKKESCLLSWNILFNESTVDCLCPYCHGKKMKLDDYPSKEIHRSHILPAVWGNIADKYWWNTIPTCCNTSQANKNSKDRIDQEDMKEGIDERIEHMFISLLHEGFAGRVRKISYSFFKYFLENYDTPIKYIGKSSLIGFTLGFYGIDSEPLIDDRWNFLFLSNDEMKDCWNLLASRLVQH